MAKTIPAVVKATLVDMYPERIGEVQAVLPDQGPNQSDRLTP
jgi:hypothetical protein